MKKEIYEIETELLNHNRFIAKGKTVIKVIPFQRFKELIEDIDKLMPNADNSNPCIKCGSVQCARCGFDLLNEFDKIKKRHLSILQK